MEKDQSGGWRSKFSVFALIASLFGAGWFAVAALGSKYGLWDWQFGLLKMTIGWGPIVLFGVLGLSVLACVFALAKAPRKRPIMLALGALLISVLLGGRLFGLGAGAQSVPPIHDIQTNWDDPIVLSDKLLAARGPDSNPVLYGDEAVFGDVGREEYQSFVGRRIADIQEDAECESDAKNACRDLSLIHI